MSSQVVKPDYGGISASRLEVLEERLRDDVIAELASFGGRLLLHTETRDGSVIPVWEEANPDHVSVLKDIMGSRHDVDGVELTGASLEAEAGFGGCVHAHVWGRRASLAARPAHAVLYNPHGDGPGEARTRCRYSDCG